MQIRRNTKSFKTIMEIVSSCQTRPDRENLVRLYATKLGHSLKDRISVEGTNSEAIFFYDLTFQAVLNNLRSSNHQLHQSDEIPGLYFFRGTLSKEWDEAPFEFDPKVKEIFSSLPELPTTRAKGKTQEFAFPAPTSEPRVKKEKEKVKPVERKAIMTIDRGPKQPVYDLKQTFLFTDLDRVVFRQPHLNKKDVLDYYNKVSDYILPYLKDRPLLVRQQSDSGPNKAYKNLEVLPKKGTPEIPAWLQDITDDDNEVMFTSPDKDHLLFCVELGCVEFDHTHSRKKSLATPDYIVVGIDSGSDFAKAVVVCIAAHEILIGLQLPAFVKTDGISGFHIYIPLDSKADFETSTSVAEYICKLIRLKIPDLVAINQSEDMSYGKVNLDHLLNEAGVGIIAPYSLAAGGPATVATPLHWEEVKEGMRLEDFNHETVFERLKKDGDPFDSLFKKKVNADDLLDRLKNNYSFLV